MPLPKKILILAILILIFGTNKNTFIEQTQILSVVQSAPRINSIHSVIF